MLPLVKPYFHDIPHLRLYPASDVTKEATALTAYSIILSISIKIPNNSAFSLQNPNLSFKQHMVCPLTSSRGRWQTSGKKCPDSHQFSRLVAVEVSSPFFRSNSTPGLLTPTSGILSRWSLNLLQCRPGHSEGNEVGLFALSHFKRGLLLMSVNNTTLNGSTRPYFDIISV